VLLETSNKSIELRKVANETPTQAEVDELKAPWEAEKKNAKEDWNVKLAAKNVSQTDLNLMYDTTPSLMGKVSSYYSFIDRDGYNFNKELYDRLGLASWVNANPTLDGGELISIARDTPLTGISLTPGDGNCVAIQQNRGELSRVTGEITLKQNLILNLESSINEDTKKINDLINISGNETEVKKLQDKIQSNSLSLKNYQKSLTDSQKEMSDIIESEDSIRASVNSQAEDIWAADPALKDAIMKEQEYEVLYNANKEAETLYTNSQQYKTVVGKAYGEISTKRDNGLAKQKSLQGDIDNGITQANTLKNQRQYLANNLEVNNKDFNTSGEKWERAEDKFRDGGFNIQIYYNDTLHKIIEGCELMGHSHGISMSGQVIKEGYTFIGKKLTEIK
jgi:hypothetical protein